MPARAARTRAGCPAGPHVASMADARRPGPGDRRRPTPRARPLVGRGAGCTASAAPGYRAWKLHIRSCGESRQRSSSTRARPGPAGLWSDPAAWRLPMGLRRAAGAARARAGGEGLSRSRGASRTRSIEADFANPYSRSIIDDPSATDVAICPRADSGDDTVRAMSSRVAKVFEHCRPAAPATMRGRPHSGAPTARPSGSCGHDVTLRVMPQLAECAPGVTRRPAGGRVAHRGAGPVAAPPRLAAAPRRHRRRAADVEARTSRCMGAARADLARAFATDRPRVLPFLIGPATMRPRGSP